MSSRKRIQRKNPWQPTPAPDILQTRGFGNGIKARQPRLPTTNDILQTRPFSPRNKDVSTPKDTRSFEEKMKGAEFGYNGASIPAVQREEVAEENSQEQAEAETGAANKSVFAPSTPPPENPILSPFSLFKADGLGQQQTVQREDVSVGEEEKEEVELGIEKQQLQSPPDDGTIQRLCAECEGELAEKEEKQPIQAKLQLAQQFGQDQISKQPQPQANPTDEEAERVRKLKEDYDNALQAAIKSSDPGAWQEVAKLLNGFSEKDILSRLKKLQSSSQQIASIHQGALDNKNVGSQSQVALLTRDTYLYLTYEKGKTEKCNPPNEPGSHPDKASDTLIARLMGKYEKIDGDPGEGCIETPYIAAPGEEVCTIGYGHQIPNCPIVDRETGEKLNAKERKQKGKSKLKCECEGQVTYDCKGKQAEQELRKDAAGAAAHVHKVVPVDLNQPEFDALVDITLHKGHVPDNLLRVIKLYWCTDAGKEYVRSVYLNTDLKAQNSDKIMPNFVNRRKHRVWSSSVPQNNTESNP